MGGLCPIRCILRARDAPTIGRKGFGKRVVCTFKQLYRQLARENDRWPYATDICGALKDHRREQGHSAPIRCSPRGHFVSGGIFLRCTVLRQ